MAKTATKAIVPIRPLDERSTVAALMEMQTLRRHCIRSQSRCDRSIEALVARSFGYHTGLPEADRKTLFKVARTLRVTVERNAKAGRPTSDPRIPTQVVNIIETSYVARAQWDRLRANIESQMAATARQLDIWPWIRNVRGVAELGLAVIIAEAGDVASYSGPAKLWKRLGLACVDGIRQGRVPPGLSREHRAEEWKRRGYNPARRAEIWAFLDDTMFRAQWRGDRDEDGRQPAKTGKPVAVPAHAIGPFGQVYGERKAWNLARGLAPRHADNEARRFMAKRFVRDLWIARRDLAIKRLPMPAEAA
jgi:hypothetical protein